MPSGVVKGARMRDSSAPLGMTCGGGIMGGMGARLGAEKRAFMAGW